VIEVVAGILFSESGEVLLARRAPHKSLPGKWEFPGGKIDAEESPEAALERELFEEFEVKTRTGRYIGLNEHDYGTFQIRLLFYESTYVSGEWVLSDHDIIEWVRIQDLKNYDLAEADLPVIKKLER
jgi:8-oxo-dGTP diphosphatase